MAKSRLTIDSEKQTRILEAAMHQFAHHGFRDTKTDAIAQAADVSKGLIFNYFGSKANLYLETVRRTYAKILKAADMSVWQDSPDLETMVARALRYKIQMQLDYPDEFALAMQAYAEVGNLPAELRTKVAAIWTTVTENKVPDMITPVLKRLPMRPGIDTQTVVNMMTMMMNLIGEPAKKMIRDDPNIQINDFDPIIAQVLQYVRILEYGFLDPEDKHD